MAFLAPNVIASNKLQIVVGATLYHFGVLNSVMHMAWVRAVSGRLESRISYAPAVYNNFPWPENQTKARANAIEIAVQRVLDARGKFDKSTLAELYDALTMPPALKAAHQSLDRAVDAAYGRKSFASDAERVAFLFELYQKYTSLLPGDTKPRKKAKAKRSH